MKNKNQQNNNNQIDILFWGLIGGVLLFPLIGYSQTNYHNGLPFFAIALMCCIFLFKLNSFEKGRIIFPLIPAMSIILWTVSVVFLINLIPFQEHDVLSGALEMAIIFGISGLIGVCYRIYAKNRKSYGEEDKYIKISFFHIILFWVAPMRILISSMFYILFRPEINPLRWVLRDSFPVIFILISVLVFWISKSYISKVFSNFGHYGKRLYFSLYLPLSILFILFFYGLIDSVLMWETSPFERQPIDVHAIARLINDIENYLYSITILDVQGHLFVGSLIIIIMITFSVWNLFRIFVDLKDVLFKSKNCTNYDKLHLIISTIILIVLCIWSLFAVALFVFPESFSYEVVSAPHLIFDALYFACTSWMIGSLDIEPNDVLSKSVVLISTISNIMFFTVFITGMFTDGIQKSKKKKHTKYLKPRSHYKKRRYLKR